MFYLNAIASLRAKLDLTAAEDHNVDLMLLHRGAKVTYRYLCQLSGTHAA